MTGESTQALGQCGLTQWVSSGQPEKGLREGPVIKKLICYTCKGPNVGFQIPAAAHNHLYERATFFSPRSNCPLRGLRPLSANLGTVLEASSLRPYDLT